MPDRHVGGGTVSAVVLCGRGRAPSEVMARACIWACGSLWGRCPPVGGERAHRELGRGRVCGTSSRDRCGMRVCVACGERWTCTWRVSRPDAPVGGRVSCAIGGSSCARLVCSRGLPDVSCPGMAVAGWR